MLKLYDCDGGVTIEGVNYDFPHIDSVVVEDPERVRLTRGANAGNKVGLSFTEGVKEPKTVTFVVLGIGLELFNLLKQVHKDKTRVDAYCVQRSDGSGKFTKQAVLSQAPQQLTLDETPESMNISLVFESFDVEDVRKS